MSAESRDHEWLPQHCPSWCDINHAEVYAENDDWAAAQQHWAGGPGGMLSVMLNPVDHRVTRPAGAGWNLHASQRADFGGGFVDTATVDLEVSVSTRDHQQTVELNLTSGEARTLARQLVAMADLLDL